MYIEEAVEPLVKSLKLLSNRDTVVLMAYGRNRFAETTFLRMAAKTFLTEDVASEELDSRYQCTDVRVLRLKKS